MKTLDPRLHAVRADLADARLHGDVENIRLANGEIWEVAAPVVNLHGEPRFDARQVTQALMGERARVFDTQEGWAWLQLETDGYVGYAAQDDLSPTLSRPTHRVAAPSTFLFPAPDLKSQPVVTVTMNARVTVAAIEEKYARLANGRFAIAGHLKPLDKIEEDFVTVAETMRHAPYLWGGKSVLGLDCSGLLQLSLQAAGIACPRDTDMQEKTLGNKLLQNDLDAVRRGDLVFWDGHVGIMDDEKNLLHANGHFMQVTLEPLREAVARIKSRYGEVTAIKRL